ncbi:MAG: PD-(D/E)XK nuclease family protein [Opitutaceae bacterium]|nr:PD-(D/E)XK nuclease family protein [Opitutaceae bacterium]
MLNSQTSLHLARHAETAWQAAIRPWLERGHGRLERAFVIVATRGQAHGLKQRCLVEGLPLLGVEFLTPGLARKKWATVARLKASAMGRELLLLQLRTLIARRLQLSSGVESAAGGAGDRHRTGEWGFWKSLESDAEHALDDFDELLKAGFGIDDFPVPPLREIFRELARWVEACGYTLAAWQAARAAAEVADGQRIAGRVLVYGLGPEMSGEFFNVAAFVRRCSDVTAVLPEPEFEGSSEHGEKWIELWGRLLGAEPMPLDAPDPERSCEPVAAVWFQHATTPVPARLVVGQTRGDEMRGVADEICALLDAGADNIGVIFPRADPAHLILARLLQERGILFADMLETAGPPAIEIQAQRALLAFYERGGRIEEFLALWPLLRAIGIVTAPLAEARRACERSFDATQSHDLRRHAGYWEKRPELARLARILGEPWPAELALAEALARFRRACTQLALESPDGWGTLDTMAAIDAGPKPLAVVTGTLASFLPQDSVVIDAPGRNVFARVTLSTRRRAEGLCWSHLVLVESNSGVWPLRQEPSCWLTDEHRSALSRARNSPPTLFNSEERAVLERAGYATLARDTRERVIFSAALSGEQDPEVKLAPNSWVERIMWANGQMGPEGDIEAAFTGAAIATGEPAAVATTGLDAWHDAWRGRRDPTRPFDEYFFSGDPARITPPKLPAKLIERGVQDPAELWFEAILKTQRIRWDPFVRARRKALGQWAHQLLANVLMPSETTRGFGEMLAFEVARQKLHDRLAAQRREWPGNRYWDSFHGELAHVCGLLLENVFTITAGRYVATEASLPPGARLELGPHRIPVVGRLDLVRLDQPAWSGARIDIVDFKTGGDLGLSAERMGRTGASLQLGVYLEAARSLGIAGGSVWMIKPEPGGVTKLTFDDMAVALTKLRWLEQALTRGVYGALTRDRSDYAPGGCDWPLACTPVSRAILEQKFALTFGLAPEQAVDE